MNGTYHKIKTNKECLFWMSYSIECEFTYINDIFVTVQEA
jgi:hypothetical protein